MGLDASPGMISHAQELLATLPEHEPLRGRVEFMHGDAASLPFDGEFDVITSWNALHWVRRARHQAAAAQP